MNDTAKENPVTEEESTAAAPDATPAAEEEVARLTAEAADLKDKLLRAMAETENVRRRGEREKQDASQYAVTSFARDLLNVADTFRRALDHLPDSAQEDATVKAFADGIAMTEQELLRAFEKHGIRKIDPVGEPFDHNFHQAMLEIPTDDMAPGTVAQVLQVGYALKDRLLRPALVGVAKPASPAASAPKVDTRV